MERTSARPPTKAPSRGRLVFRAVLRWTKRAALTGLLLGLAAAAYALYYVRSVESELPSVIDLKHSYKPPQVTRVLARDGSVLAELFTERRTLVTIESLPAHVKLAVLAAEDATFYEHEGLNYLGILRAMIVNLRSGQVRQGGSTITQQVVKNVLLDSERTYRRKVREALLSRKLEQELKKDEILELYLNHIYFGHGRYGIEEASRDLFGKSAKDLTVAEAALLAGIIACPESCTPRRDMKKAMERRSVALTRMLDKGFLKQAQFDAAKEEPVRLAAVVEAGSELAPEVVSIVRKTLHDLVPERAAQGGFTVHTTIDPRMQAAARKAVRDNLQAYDKRHALQGALPVPETPAPPKTGKGKTAPPPKPNPKTAPFEGTPSFESHKVYVGVVEGANDEAGTFDVRVGTVLGSVRLADFERYNPQKLKPSSFAPKGARARVSLLGPAPVQEIGKVTPKVPLRLELGPEAAFVALEVRSRDVLAIVGNYEAQAGALDRATQSRRQPGSTFKPIVYSYALHSKTFTPASLIDVTPASFGDYKPSNYEGWTARDPLRLREVLAQSVNIGAVRVLDTVGPHNVVAWAQAMGITTPLKPDLSLALGSYEVEPIELVGAYATFAGGGTYSPSRLIVRIVGADGKDLELKQLPPSRRVMDEAEAYLITHMMTSVVDHGTATRAKVLGRPVAGKTGTSNASKDTWFAGFTTEIAAVSWVGYDDGRPLGSTEAGAGTALPAWIAFMKSAMEKRPPTDFVRPSGVTAVKIDTKTGKLPYADDPDVMDELFLDGTEPKDTAEVPVPDGGLPPLPAGPDAGSMQLPKLEAPE
ncbi:MAG: PBP1A family penicillin-binding protein [Polyangiaceae bacterium]